MCLTEEDGYVCTECGLVLQGLRLVDMVNEERRCFYDYEDHRRTGPVRMLHMCTCTSFKSQVPFTTLHQAGGLQRPPDNIDLYEQAGVLDVTTGATRLAQEIYHKAFQNRSIPRGSLELLSLACIFVACKATKEVLSLQDCLKPFGLLKKKKALARVAHELMRHKLYKTTQHPLNTHVRHLIRFMPGLQAVQRIQLEDQAPEVVRVFCTQGALMGT